jgi:4-hydroxy-tetrahydrodipicolinate synthase
MHNSFHGIWVPIITPFQDGKIDFPALRKLTDRSKEGGVSGLVACSTTGEAASLGEEEQLAVLDAVIEAAGGLPVVMGLCGNNLDDIHARLRRIQLRPIAGLLVPPPYYIRPSQEGVCAYFKSIADAAIAPIIIYNIPYRTGVTMTLETIRKIAEHPNVAAIKDCGGDAALTMQMIRDGRLAVLTGEDLQIFSTLCLGGAGAIAASAHLHPELFVRLAELIRDEKLTQAREIFYRLLPMIQLLFTEANPAPVKAALAHLGIVCDELREPMQRASDQLADKLITELQNLRDAMAKAKCE